MATRLTKEYLRGVMVSRSLTPADFDSPNATGYSTFDTIPDQPIPNPPSKMVLNSSGECLQTTDIDVITFRSGVSSTARYVIKDRSDSTTVLYGYNAPNTIQDWDVIAYSPSSSAYNYYNPDVLTLEDGSFITVFDSNYNLGSPRKIRACIVSKDGIKSFITIETLITTSLKAGFPCICQLPDQTILVGFFDLTDDKLQMKLYRSTDNGASFVLINDKALDSMIDVSAGNYTLEKARIKALGGQVLLIIGAKYSGTATNKNQALQYASSDGGCNFTFVTTEEASQPFNRPELFIFNNQFAVAYTTTKKLEYVILPHAYYPIQSLIKAGKQINIRTSASNQYATGTDANMLLGDICACSNSNNEIIVIAQDEIFNATRVFYSSTGSTFGDLFNANLFFIDSTTRIEGYVISELDSRFVLVHSWDSAPATNENSIAVAYLGGFSNHDYAYADSFPRPFDNNRTQFNQTYLPIEKTQHCSIFTVTGTYTETLVARENVITVNNNSYEAKITNTVQVQFGCMVRGVIKVDSGSTLKLQLKHDDGANQYITAVNFTGTQIVDVASSTTVLHDCTVPVEFIYYQRLGVEKFYFRTHSISNIKKFTLFAVTNSTAGTTGTFNESSLSITDSTGTNRNAYIYQFMMSSNYANGDFQFETINEGRRYPVPTKTQYVIEGVRISALGGTTYKSNEFNIKPTSPYSIDNTLFNVSPSPRVTYRSAAVVSGSIAQMKIPFNLGMDELYFDNDLIAIQLSNINFEEFKIQRYTGGAFVDYGTFNSSSGMSHACTIRGKTLAPNTAGSSTNNNYYFFNELKDNIVKVTSTSGTEYKRIVSNSEGVYGTSQSKPCIITLESELSTTDLTGTFQILSKDVVVLINLNQISGSNTIQKFAIQISTQETIDNYFQIGAINIGAVAITGQQYSKGRRITIEAGSIQNIQNDRTIYTRNVAPDQRSVQIAWSDGVDISTLYNSNPDPDYYGASNAGSPEPVSVYKDAPYLIEGLLREVKGSNRPLVYMPSIETGFSTKILNRRHEFMYCYLDSEVQIQSVTGDELIGNGQGEVMRIANIDLVEIV